MRFGSLISMFKNKVFVWFVEVRIENRHPTRLRKDGKRSLRITKKMISDVSDRQRFVSIEILLNNHFTFC